MYIVCNTCEVQKLFQNFVLFFSFCDIFEFNKNFKTFANDNVMVKAYT